MGWAIAAGRVVARGAEANRLAAEDRFERIAASLREQHLRTDPVRHRRPLEDQRFRQIGHAAFGEEAAQRVPQPRVGRPHLRQIVHRQAGGRVHRPASMAARTRSGVNGIALTRTPTASSIALAMAAATPSMPLSPSPLAPNGPGPPCSTTNPS